MSAVEDLALKSLMDAMDRDDTERLRNSLPKRLREHFSAHRVVVTIIDGSDSIGQFSKDLAFELYTSPEPNAMILMLSGLALIAAWRRKA